jgi:excisionase family DNA binding protein
LWQRLCEKKNADTTTDSEAVKLLTVPQAAKLMAIPSGRAYELARQGKLPSVRIGKYVRVRQPDLRRWIDSQP